MPTLSHAASCLDFIVLLPPAHVPRLREPLEAQLARAFPGYEIQVTADRMGLSEEHGYHVMPVRPTESTGRADGSFTLGAMPPAAVAREIGRLVAQNIAAGAGLQ